MAHRKHLRTGVIRAHVHDTHRGCKRATTRTLQWEEPFTCLRAPKVFNLGQDPYERADVVSDQYYDWEAMNAFLMAQSVIHASALLNSLVEYPPGQRPASLSIDQVQRDVGAKNQSTGVQSSPRSKRLKQ